MANTLTTIDMRGILRLDGHDSKNKKMLNDAKPLKFNLNYLD